VCPHRIGNFRKSTAKYSSLQLITTKHLACDQLEFQNESKTEDGKSTAYCILNLFINIPQFLRKDFEQFGHIHPQYSPQMVPTAEE